MPTIGDVPNIDFPTVERAALSNGVEIVYAQSTTVPVTRVAVEFDAGYAADDANALGVHSMMLNLMQEGTTTRDSNALAEAQERLGASVNLGASMDRTAASLTAVTTNLDPSLVLLADMVRNSAFAPAEVERLRAQRLAALANERTQPAAIAARALPALIYGETNPYGRPFNGTGSPETITALTREDLIAEHAQWVRPDNARIFVVSDLPLADVRARLERAFGDWQAPAAPRGTKAFPADIPATTARIVLIDRPQSPQSIIYGGAVLPVSGTDDLVTLHAPNPVPGPHFQTRAQSDLAQAQSPSEFFQLQSEIAKQNFDRVVASLGRPRDRPQTRGIAHGAIVRIPASLEMWRGRGRC